MLWQPLYSFTLESRYDIIKTNIYTMNITLEKLNTLPYEQMLCVHFVMCPFVAQHEQELMESGMMGEEVIKMYRHNVEHLIPGSDAALVQSTNELLWNLVRVAAETLAQGINVDFVKQVIKILLAEDLPVFETLFEFGRFRLKLSIGEF